MVLTSPRANARRTFGSVPTLWGDEEDHRRLIANTLNDLTTRELQIVRATDYGAIPDGTGDSGPAFNAAIAALPNGGVILVNGRFRTTTTIAVNKKVTMIGWGYSENSGNGSPSEIKKGASLSGACILITSHAVNLQNFCVEGETGNGGDGIVVSGEANSVSLRDISVHNQGRHGINIGAGANSGHQNLCRMDNITCHGNGDDEDGDGVHIDYGGASTNANTGTITGINSSFNSRDGIYIDGAGGWTIVGGTAEQNTRYGMYLGPNSSKNTIWGGVLNESNGTKDLFVDTGAEQNWIIGNALLSSETTDNGTETFIQTVDTPGTKLSNVEYNSVSTGTTTIPQDDTIPQNTEGNEYMTLAVTRKTGDGSTFYVWVTIHLASSVVNNMIAALFINSVASAIAVGTEAIAVANDVCCITFQAKLAAPAGTTTFKVRAGGSAAGTTTFNGAAGSRLFGGVLASSIRVLEATS